MADPEPSSGAPAGGSDPPAEPRVAEVLQQLRSGVLQRSAELAAFGGIGERGGMSGAGEMGGSAAAQPARQWLAALRAHEYVQEPIAFSHRRRLGRFIVLCRKAFFHLFLKWFLRPVIEQQNAFNQAAGRLLQELVEAQDRQARELRQLAARLDRLEAQDSAPAHARSQDSAPPAAPHPPGGAVE